MTLQDLRSDVTYLINKFGHVPDFCGAWCNCEVLEDILLRNSSRDNIKYHLMSWIDRYFEVGYEVQGSFTKMITLEDIESDSRLKNIADRHLHLNKFYEEGNND